MLKALRRICKHFCALLMVFTIGCSQQSVHQVAAKGDLAKVKWYLQNGMNVNVKDNDGRTPLVWAVSKVHLDIVSFLIHNGADVNAKDNAGLTPLMIAGRHPDVVALLKQHGAKE